MMFPHELKSGNPTLPIKMVRKVLFLTGTRADYGKLKPLIVESCRSPKIETHIFVTGMHLLEQYGSTHTEVVHKDATVFKFKNQSRGAQDFQISAKTLLGLGKYVLAKDIDLIVVHGDRLEALAGAQVGVMTNTLVAHVEGGELSGTIDDSYRHAITKLAHLHFVANASAKKRLLQLGENDETIHVIGSPELDLMHSASLPSLAEVQERYAIPFDEYGIVIFHPVVTEKDESKRYARELKNAIMTSNTNWVLIESNNDQGSDGIRSVMKDLRQSNRVRCLPSMRYEFFLTLLQNSRVVLGNSSVGVREAPHYGVPSVNIGTRQSGRTNSPMVYNAGNSSSEIANGLSWAVNAPRVPDQRFGDGKSAYRFARLLCDPKLFDTPIQKKLYEEDEN